MTAVLSAMRVELTFNDGRKQVLEVQSYALLKTCAWTPCAESFRTTYLEQVYCSNECAKQAANQRYKSKPSTPTY